MVKSEYIESDGEESKVKKESKKVSRSKSSAKLLKKKSLLNCNKSVSDISEESGSSS